MAGSSIGLRLSTIDLFLRNTRRQDRTCIPSLVSRSRLVAGDPLELLGVLHDIERGGDGSSPSSDDDETEDYRVEHRKRKSTDRDLDVDSPDDEEIEEEEAPLMQHPPQGGQPAHSIRYGMLEVHSTKVLNYVARVNYKAKGMTERAREQRSIDPRS